MFICRLDIITAFFNNLKLVLKVGSMHLHFVSFLGWSLFLQLLVVLAVEADRLEGEVVQSEFI